MPARSCKLVDQTPQQTSMRGGREFSCCNRPVAVLVDLFVETFDETQILTKRNGAISIRIGDCETLCRKHAAQFSSVQRTIAISVEALKFGDCAAADFALIERTIFVRVETRAARATATCPEHKFGRKF